MALWRDPLDELIDELERVVLPELSTRQWNLHEYMKLVAEAQAEVAAIAFSPEATLPPEDQTRTPPPTPNPDSAVIRLVTYMRERREQWSK